ncbi:MAG: sigma-70 family RNA polymerase sigma factor, partial [Verrucomicrobiota bacterium]
NSQRPNHILKPEDWNANYRESLIRFAHQKVSDLGAAEDLVQETFISAWKARKRFRGECSERTYLIGVLRNKVIDHYRKVGRRPSVLATDLDYSDEEQQGSWLERQPDSSRGQDTRHQVERHEFLVDLEQAVEKLPDKMQQAFRMRELEGRSTDEITSLLKISTGNLWVLIHRAKQMLKSELEENWMGARRFGGIAPV